ncbi:MAG TPA: hypothetical protein VHF51_07640 [Solirubrobacteraceae bacterium]|nr:hypothetical protein [Solirubrobacteraceae bacterium]
MSRSGWAAAGAAAALAAVTLGGLHVARGLDYWNYSEGVYALSSRLLLSGDDLYGDVVAAQPPWLFLVGAGVLWLGDSIDVLRLGLGVAQLAAGLLGARAVWRLTHSAAASALTAPLTLLTPWAVHEHGSLTPEVLVAPILLGAALLSTRPRSAPVAGALAATAPFVKWPFLIVVPVVVALSARPRRAAVGALLALAVQGLAFTLVFGDGVWTHTILAQLNSGRRNLLTLDGVAAQAAWNLAGLLALTAIAAVRHRAADDAPLLRALGGLAAAVMLTLATVVKEGTALNVLVPVEAVLLPLAITGGVLAIRAARTRAVPVLGVVVALAFTFAQTASILTSDVTRTPFTIPTAELGAWGRVATGAEVERQAARARRCPPGVPFSGPPFIAFVARRQMPGGQPDQFLPAHSSSLRAELAEINAAAVRCP